MDIEFFGANCFRIKTKKSVFITDDNLASLGQKSITKLTDTLLTTNNNIDTTTSAAKAKLVLDSPGEFEVGDVTVHAEQTRGHMDEEGSPLSAIVYQLLYKGTTVTILGHVHPDMSAEALELITGTDLLLVPVGGHGFTLDAVGAMSIVKKAEPGITIPSSYDINGFKYEVAAAPLEEFTKLSSLESIEEQDSFKLGSQSVDEQSGQTTVVVLKTKKA